MIGEYDGQEKYDRLARAGETPAMVVRREKRRQEAFENHGWVVARWGREEVRDPERLRRVILRAFNLAEGRRSA